MEEKKSLIENNNDIKSNPLNRIGNFIREARLSRDQSIEELASILKIGAHQLKAIEDGNADQLPEEVFVKAMVRRISQKLKLDTEFIMAEFNKERREVAIEEIVEEVNIKSKKSKKRNPVNFGILIILSGFLGIIASSFIINLLSEYFQNETPKQEINKKIFKNLKNY